MQELIAVMGPERIISAVKTGNLLLDEGEDVIVHNEKNASKERRIGAMPSCLACTPPFPLSRAYHPLSG